MKEIEQQLDGKSVRVGIVLGRFNRDIGDGLLSACVSQLRKRGVADNAITLACVPGALEIPVTLRKMAQSGCFDTLIALGAVIRGETYHFEVVANESARGILEVQLLTGIPIANAILTTEDDDQAQARMAVKGAEAADVALEMFHLLDHL